MVKTRANYYHYIQTQAGAAAEDCMSREKHKIEVLRLQEFNMN